MEEYLESAEGQEEVLQEDARAKQEMGIQSVPYFLIGCSDSDRRYRLSGAQAGAAFMEAFSNCLKA